MNDHTRKNATPLVQAGRYVSIGMGKLLPIGVAVFGVAARQTSAAMERKRILEAEAEAVREQVKSALQDARDTDLALALRQQRKQAKKKLREQRQSLLRDLAELAESLHGKGGDVSAIAAVLAESPILEKLREFGEEAQDIVEQGKMRSAQKMDALHTASREGSQHAIDRVRSNADKLGVQTQDVLADLSAHANTLIDELGRSAEARRQDAQAAVTRGRKEARSLLLWFGAAGAIIYKALLTRQQQQQIRNAGAELLGELSQLVRRMISGSTR